MKGTLSSSGVLSGTPGPADVGTFANIALGVTDGKSPPVVLSVFTITVPKPNRAPMISGAPTTTATVGTQYSFTPAASDPDSADTLTFGVQNLPAWATFDPVSGRLEGMPGVGDVGMASDIVISVQDAHNESASLAAFSIAVQSNATRSTLLIWVPPTDNADGSPLTDLAGYRIYWGTSPETYTESIVLNQPGLASYLVEHLTPNTYFFVITALNNEGFESEFSNVASITLP